MRNGTATGGSGGEEEGGSGGSTTTGGKSGTWIRHDPPSEAAPAHARPRPGARVAGRTGSKHKGKG